MKKIALFSFCLSLFLLACQADSVNSNWKPLDLLSYGVPITLMAPDSAAVTVDDLLGQKDITIEGENFSVQLFVYDATTTNAAEVKNEKLREVQEQKYFSKVIKDEPTGFIYETVIDSTYKSYRFYHIKIKGDKEFLFQSGLRGQFSQEQAEATYQAVSELIKR